MQCAKTLENGDKDEKNLTKINGKGNAIDVEGEGTKQNKY